MSIEDINNAAAAQNALTARINGFMDDADDQIGQRQQAYDNLAGNLRGVVADEMHWVATVDPAAVEVTGNDGTYQTIKAAIDDAPRGGMITLNIAEGVQLTLADQITSVKAQHVRLVSANPSDKSRLIFPTYVNNAVNNGYNRFSLLYNAHISLIDLELELQAKSDPALPWASNGAAPFQPNFGQMGSITLEDCEVFGSDGGGLINAYQSALTVSMRNCTFDGAFSGIVNGQNGTINLAYDNITLLNGAALRTGGTVGTNVIEG